MAISDEFLSELRDKIDIAELVSPYVRLKRRGRTYVGLCPFHNEKTPSFTVYPDSNSFYCFGCGAGGDIITFVKRIENYDYVEAVRSLADKAGLNMPEEGFDDSLAQSRRRMLAANREAARFFHECLYDECGRRALEYLTGRGLTKKTITRFGLGYAPDSWDSLLNHLRNAGFSSQELYEANLIRKKERDGRTSYYDNFRNRFMTPIIDVRGNVIAFGGRVLDDSKPKYVNTSDTLVYKKSKNVFALNYAKNDNGGKLILAEGYMDVIALHQAGFTNAVAGLGTALTREQVNLLSRYADEIILSYDADEAGRAACEKAMALINETGLKLKVLNLSGGKDPDEIIKKYGAERFEQILTGAENEIEFKLERERKRFDLQGEDGKINYIKAAVAVLSASGDSIAAEMYASKIGDELSVSKETILRLIEEQNRKRRLSKQKESYRQGEKIIGEARKRRGDSGDPRLHRAEETVLASMMRNPDFFSKLVCGRLRKEDFSSGFYARLFEKLSERIAQGRDIDLIHLREGFTDDEVSGLARLNAMARQLQNSEKECTDCINVILDEKNKEKTPVDDNLSLEDWSNMIKNMKK